MKHEELLFLIKYYQKMKIKWQEKLNLLLNPMALRVYGLRYQAWIKKKKSEI